ncbi:DUF4012 domain-containing protein [Aeromicrobium chenweiae]|nr:DUF4012 domain-containing protein [Aeromicrobium chenweiae]
MARLGHRASGPTRSRRPLVYGLGAVVVLVVVAGALLARQASTAKTALEDAASQAKILQNHISQGDVSAARSSLEDLQSSTGKAHTNTDGLVWSLLTKMPFVGDSVSAVRTVSSTLDDISRRGLPPVVEASASLDGDLFKPRNGAFDLAAFSQLGPTISTAAEVLTTNQRKIASIQSDELVGPLRAPVKDLKEKVDDAQFAASSAARAMRLAPEMLGARGTRRYLLVFQNNAEVRSTGGLPGAFAVVKAKNGKLSITQQGSASDIPQYEDPFVKLTKSEAAVYGQLMAKDFRDTNFTPDFPRTAKIMRSMVVDKLGVKVDGVLSLDPVALSHLLKGTGPIKAAADTELTADNAVDLLLNDVYARFTNPVDQDAFFADSARRIFEGVTSGKGDARETLSQLVTAAGEHRVLLWSARTKEQREIAPTTISGAFPGKGTTRPHVGMYLNDSTASKMQYYLDTKTTARSIRCTDDGRQTIELTTTFTSTAPADASLLPKYITGVGGNGPRGSMVLDTRFFAPAGGEFISFTQNGKFRPNNGVTFHGRPVNFAAITLKPGATVKIVATMRTAKGQRADAELSSTPGAHSSDNEIFVRSSC